MADGWGSGIVVDAGLADLVPYSFADVVHDNRAVTLPSGVTVIGSGIVDPAGPSQPVFAYVTTGGLDISTSGSIQIDFIVNGTVIFSTGVFGPGGLIGPVYGPMFFEPDTRLAFFVPGAPWSIRVNNISGTAVITNIGAYLLVL